jgi:hypothetical protein
MNEYRLKGESIPSRRNGEGVAEHQRQNSLVGTRIRIRDQHLERKVVRAKYGLSNGSDQWQLILILCATWTVTPRQEFVDPANLANAAPILIQEVPQ